ncbi:uncharacterized protein BCR38DRAFT_123782 [Pseudomassariella vexata]|uniref:Uncharacterized protein n=1 Tax=Pseudomassariella vexata TaxID=1141098 RepID=A0A1Y2DAL5_9PEZI|nr:uncharacterized protein BCR38DRAFT_123782 [Pseudomassariella vexata]ORY55705.1 hypothetical protein BCR38DRAFT_123782 [Pseudomassariella vexata]
MISFQCVVPLHCLPFAHLPPPLPLPLSAQAAKTCTCWYKLAAICSPNRLDSEVSWLSSMRGWAGLVESRGSGPSIKQATKAASMSSYWNFRGSISLRAASSPPATPRQFNSIQETRTWKKGTRLLPPRTAVPFGMTSAHSWGSRGRTCPPVPRMILGRNLPAPRLTAVWSALCALLSQPQACLPLDKVESVRKRGHDRHLGKPAFASCHDVASLESDLRLCPAPVHASACRTVSFSGSVWYFSIASVNLSSFLRPKSPLCSSATLYQDLEASHPP